MGVLTICNIASDADRVERNAGRGRLRVCVRARGAAGAPSGPAVARLCSPDDRSASFMTSAQAASFSSWSRYSMAVVFQRQGYLRTVSMKCSMAGPAAAVRGGLARVTERRSPQPARRSAPAARPGPDHAHRPRRPCRLAARYRHRP